MDPRPFRDFRLGGREYKGVSECGVGICVHVCVCERMTLEVMQYGYRYNLRITSMPYLAHEYYEFTSASSETESSLL